MAQPGGRERFGASFGVAPHSQPFFGDAPSSLRRCPPQDLTRHMAEYFNSLLEPVKKLQSAALLLDFWLGQGVRAVAIPAACCRCFASPCGLPSAGCLPSLGCPARATQAKPKRHATLWVRARKAVWPRCPLGYSPLRGCALACALPYGLSCSRAALSNFHRFLGGPAIFPRRGGCRWPTI